MTALDGSVDVPVVGKTPKKGVAVAVVAVAVIVGFAYWRKSQGGDGSGGELDYYADTRTGSELPTDAYTNPAPGSNSGDPGDQVWSAPKTDQEWAQQVLEKLTWYEPGFLSAIVGKYLAKQPTTPEEQTVVREAWAQVGKPPGGQSLVTATGTVTGTKPPAPHLHHVLTTRNSATLQWNSGGGNTATFKVYRSGGITVASGIKGLTYTVAGLKPNTRYSFSVAAVAVDGTRSGSTSNVVTVTTKK